MHTGENEQGLRKITDMTRLMSMLVLGLHFYYYCYKAFEEWKLTAEISDRLLKNIGNTGLFTHFNNAKLIALILLIISLFGARGKKDEKINHKNAFAYIITGLLIYFLSYFSLFIPASVECASITYMLPTITGYSFVLAGGTMISLIIRHKLSGKHIC